MNPPEEKILHSERKDLVGESITSTVSFRLVRSSSGLVTEDSCCGAETHGRAVSSNSKRHKSSVQGTKGRTHFQSSVIAR